MFAKPVPKKAVPQAPKQKTQNKAKALSVKAGVRNPQNVKK